MSLELGTTVAEAMASDLCVDISEQAKSYEEKQNEHNSEGKIGDPNFSNRSGDHDPNTTKRSGVFRYADRFDCVLMLLGTLGAAGEGMLLTIFSVFFGELVCASL